MRLWILVTTLLILGVLASEASGKESNSIDPSSKSSKGSSNKRVKKHVVSVYEPEKDQTESKKGGSSLEESDRKKRKNRSIDKDVLYTVNRQSPDRLGSHEEEEIVQVKSKRVKQGGKNRKQSRDKNRNNTRGRKGNRARSKGFGKKSNGLKGIDTVKYLRQLKEEKVTNETKKKKKKGRKRHGRSDEYNTKTEQESKFKDAKDEQDTPKEELETSENTKKQQVEPEDNSKNINTDTSRSNDENQQNEEKLLKKEDDKKRKKRAYSEPKQEFAAEDLSRHKKDKTKITNTKPTLVDSKKMSSKECDTCVRPDDWQVGNDFVEKQV